MSAAVRTPEITAPDATASAKNPWIVCHVGSLSIRFRQRSALAGLGLIIVVLVVGLISLASGSMDISFSETLQALVGQGSDSAVRSIQGRRLPRAILAILVGACLGMSGALFQAMSRNVLGSPDIIGFTSGATAGAVFAITVGGGGILSTAISAIVGGFVAAILVYTLARRDGVTGGMRLVLVGIGVGAITSAISSLLMVRADMNDAATAQLWSAGALIGRGWPYVGAVALGLTILAIPLAICARPLALMDMGDDAAASVGVHPERLRLAIMIIGVGLVGIGVAATGPIAFIALAAPQIARRIQGHGGFPLWLSALTGGTLLLLADLISQLVSWHIRMPVGYVTSLVGGIYLVVLLVRKV